MPRGRQFRKGESGNPGGRPRETAHVREAARAHTAEAIETLAAIMRDENEAARARVAAAEALLNRAWGRAEQAHRIEAGEDGGGLVVHVNYGVGDAATGESSAHSPAKM